MPTVDRRTGPPVPPPGPVDADLAGLDALEAAARSATPLGQRIWQSTWPKLAALALGLVLWQLVVWSGWKPEYVLPGPGAVFSDLWDLVQDGTVAEAAGITLRRAAVGFALAVVIGTTVGSLVARIRPLRAAVGSLITGVQTMPSIAWFPLAILIFKLSEQAILFVVVLGAAPAIANGLITGADHIPPILLRAGRVLGARGFAAYRHVILPASLPAFVGGLKQGWAFAWRSLMAGELIVIIAGKPSIGSLLQNYRNLNNAEGLMAMMIVILVIGIAVDTLLFGSLDRTIRRRWGLVDPAP
ncbi:MAG TPA: ABC transporter permease [Acidimicrobiales bacterium]|nr:ABC transporter permease [Acidimicrobiales bacterium]